MRWALPLSLLLVGCSALGLADDLTQESPCRSCAELNAIDPPPSCMSWQCSAADAVCVLDVEDRDEDGAQSARCVVEGEPDCDDADPRNRPRADGELAECLDAMDNDCDEAIDEALFRATPLAVRPLREADHFVWSADGRAAAFRERSAGGTLRLLRVEDGGSVVDVTSADGAAINPVQIALGGDPTSPLVIYQPLGAACGPLFLGQVAGASLRVTQAMMMPAPLPRLGGECGAGAMETDVSEPSVALDQANHAVALWLEGGADREACGAMAESVVAIGARVDGAGAPTLEGEATLVGTHGGLGAASLVSIGAGELVAALVTASGTVELRRITARVPLEIAPSPLHTEPTCGAGCGRVALAVSGDELALAFRAGGCDDAEIRVRRFTVEGAALTPLDAAATIVEAGDVAQIALTRRAGRWAVAWSEGPRLFYVELGADGAAGPVARVAEQGAAVDEPIALTLRDDAVLLHAHDRSVGAVHSHAFTACP